MNVRLEAINLLKKIHRGLKYNYVDSELKEISEYLAGCIGKNDRYEKRVKNLLEAIKERDKKIYSLKQQINNNLPKTKGKEIELYNYIETSTINEALEMLKSECKHSLKDKSNCEAILQNKINICEKIINKNNELLKKWKVEGE